MSWKWLQYNVAKLEVAIVGIKECKTCNLYSNELGYERERREYYEQLLLTKAGIINQIKDDDIDLSDSERFPSVRRITTFSALRHIAEDLKLKQKKEADLAQPSEKTEAEEIFERELNGKSQAS